MIRRPPRSTLDRSSAASDVYKRQLLCGARAMGEFGAVSVVSGHIRGLTNTLPLHIEILYNEFDSTAAFAAASLLSGLALVTLVIKFWLEARHGDALAKTHRRH